MLQCSYTAVKKKNINYCNFNNIFFIIILWWGEEFLNNPIDWFIMTVMIITLIFNQIT